MSKKIRVRFAPSPTGFLHIGGLRTALYNWLFARKHKGIFVLRIEDTDRSRLVEGAMENLYRSLDALGIAPDEGYSPEGDTGDFGPYVQSKRREKHLAYAYELIEKDKAYYCFCDEEELARHAEERRKQKLPTMYSGKCRDMDKKRADSMAAAGEAHVIRLKTPQDGSIKMKDMIRGEIEIGWDQVDDQVLVKTDGFPTYHLAATCDDHDMEITHVIRGEEWISSLPKHVYLYECFGWRAPDFAHLPLLLNSDKSKLSKRQGDVAVEDYLNKGYLPEALLNFVALLGWNPSADREIFMAEELAKSFDITKVNKSGAVFNVEKLDWMNGEYIKSLAPDAYAERAEPFLAALNGDADLMRRAAMIFQDRVSRLGELEALVKDFLGGIEKYPAERLVWKKSSAEEARERLSGVRELISGWDNDAFESMDEIEKRLKAFIEKQGWGNGDTLWPLRVALSGREKSPSPFEFLYVFQKEECLKRIDDAINLLA